MNSNKTTLTKRLQEYSKSSVCPMHMPGHKRQNLTDSVLPLHLDITEITGFDNLHDAQGILKESMQQAARLYGAKRSFFLVNGSSGGILAGISAACPQNGKILLGRGCHKSVYHAIELCGLTPVYLMPDFDPDFGIAESVSPAAVEKALQTEQGIDLVLITSPTYEGVISDIAAIAELCSKKGIPLMVDEAHGAHLDFCSAFSGGAVKAGADIVIQSLHKTLPSPTQTAIAHLNGDLVSENEFTRRLAMFQTSSPSYLLLCGIADCIQLLEQKKESLFDAYCQRLERFSQQMQALKHFRVLGYGVDRLSSHKGIFAFDKGKLVISTRGTNHTGTSLKDALREQYGIELEMAMGDYALAMTSVADTPQMMQRLAEALLELDNAATPAQTIQTPSLCLPPLCILPSKARTMPTKRVPLQQAKGQICAENVWAYPPGIPLITAGEKLDLQFLETVQKLCSRQIELHNETGGFPQWVCVVDCTAKQGQSY